MGIIKMKAVVICTILAMALAGPTFDIASKLKGNDGAQCASSSASGFDVSAFNVTPYPVVRGNVSMTMTGTSEVNADISGLSIEVIYKGVPFYHETVPQSGSLVAGSPHTVNFSTNIPGIAPPGSYNIQVGL